MKRPSLLILVGVLVSATAAAQPAVERHVHRDRRVWLERYQEARQGPEQTERITRSFRVGRSPALELSNVAGDIVITGGSGDEIAIEAIKRARHQDEGEAKRLLAALEVEATERPSRVEVRTIYPRQVRRASLAVDYTVRVPAETTVEVKSVSGDVKVMNIKGELRAESVSGNVGVGAAERLALLKSISGDVEITDGSADSVFTASSVSGNLTAKGLKARALEISSVSGNVMLSDTTSERAQVRSVSGDIEYSGGLARNGRYDLNSHSGDLRLALAANVGFELDATTFSGTVRSDLPVTLRAASRDDREPLRGRGRSSRAVRGTYGDGSALVLARTFSGNITIVKR